VSSLLCVALVVCGTCGCGTCWVWHLCVWHLCVWHLCVWHLCGTCVALVWHLCVWHLCVWHLYVWHLCVWHLCVWHSLCGTVCSSLLVSVLTSALFFTGIQRVDVGHVTDVGHNARPKNKCRTPARVGGGGKIIVYCTCWWYSLCNFQYRQHYENTCSYNFDC
jgi:hypothetical protein